LCSQRQTMKQVLLIAALIITVTLTAQVRISGSVKDNRGRILAGASITLKGTYDGAVSDSTGNFSFKTFEKGEKLLAASNIGNKTVEEKINIQKENIQVDFVLKEEVSELKAVSVTAGAFEASDKKKATVLSTLDVLTTGGANADIVAAVKTLPGAQQVGESEGLFVRGGTGYEAKQFIDGTVVNNPFFSSVPDIASRGRFSPMLFKGTVFSTGGYSALYGQALSSALIMESIDIPEQSQASASISSVFTGGGYQQLAKDKKSSWGVSYGYVNLKPYFEIVKQKPDYFKVPQLHNGDANFRFKTKNGGIIKYYGTFGQMQMGLRRPDIDSLGIKDAFGLENLNWYNNLSWRENLGNGWKMNLGLSYSLNRDDIQQQLQDQQNQPKTFTEAWLQNKNFTLHQRQDLSQAKIVFDKKITGISVIRFGSEYWYGWNKVKYNGYTTLLKDNFKAVFSEADLYITNDIAAKVGVRAEHSSVINKLNAAPRISLAYKTGKDAQVSLAYGIFYQKPENLQLLQTTDLGYTRATHYIANYQKMNRFYTLRAEVFYKKYNDLVKTVPSYSNNGSGYAQGFEFFWRDKKTIKNLDYWISYSYLDTKRDHLNYPYQIAPSFAATHTASIVTKRWVTKWKTGFNFTYSFATGRPYYNFRNNSTSGKSEIADEGRTKQFHNMGFSMNYVPTLGKSKKNFIVLVASVTNVLGSDQVYGYNYSYNGLRKEAITPPSKRFVFIGAFFSWGVDKTQDAINNNL
jgi:vitamin B12 transporter